MMASHISICENTEKFLQNLTNTCPLCFNKVFLHKSRLLRHVWQKHINHSAAIGEHTILLCKLNCNDEYPTFAGHYHCPAPSCNISKKKCDRLLHHFEKHVSAPCEEINPALLDIETERRERLRSILVDPEKEIYMVSRNKIGLDVPIHVIKKTQKQTHSSRCSNIACQESIEMARTQGLFNFECMHLAKVKTSTLQEDPWYYNELRLSSCLSENERKIFLKEIRIMINNKKIPVMEWIVNSRFTYYSVHCCKNYFLLFSRVFVKYDNLESKYFCDCQILSKTQNCTHVCICKVYRNQKSQKISENECLPPITKTTSAPSNWNKFKLTEKEVAYQLKEKKYPQTFPKACYAKSPAEFRAITELSPKETICKLCSTVLSQVQVLTRKGVLIHANMTCQDITIYYKQCPNCATRFFYKEWEDGIHLFEKTVLSLDLCMLIRNGLKNSTSVGRTVDSVLQFVQSVSNDLEIVSKNDARQCYTNFEVMTNHTYRFTCNICGDYPTVLMTDVCRKGFFHLPAETRSQISDEPRSMEEFWTNLEHAIILRKDLNEVVDKWSPWISPCNVLPTVQSTEAQKCKFKDVNLEDSTMISQEELQKAFRSKCKKELIQYLKTDLKMDVEDKSSKEQLMSKIINELYFSDAFKEKLSSYAGMSGIFLTFACTHGVVYAAKALLKHESPSDYADVILSFRHKPAIVICDMPDRIARHLSKRDTSVLRPNLGMLAAPTEENMTLAKIKDLHINLPCLKKKRDAQTASNEHSYCSTRVVNPITQSSEVYILYDEFHKRNTSKQSECMRDAELVPELRSIYTQTSEQSNYKIGRKHYFMDRMEGKVNFFYLRLVIHLSNEAINSKNLLVKKKLFPGFAVKKDHFGRLYHSISKNINAEEMDTDDEKVDDQSGSDSENESNENLLLEHITLMHTAANRDDFLSKQLEPAVTSSSYATSNLDGAPDSCAVRSSPNIQEESSSVVIPSLASGSATEENLKTTTEQENYSTTKIFEMKDHHSPSSAGCKLQQQEVSASQPLDWKECQTASSLDNVDGPSPSDYQIETVMVCEVKTELSGSEEVEVTIKPEPLLGNLDLDIGGKGILESTAGTSQSCFASPENVLSLQQVIKVEEGYSAPIESNVGPNWICSASAGNLQPHSQAPVESGAGLSWSGSASAGNLPLHSQVRETEEVSLAPVEIETGPSWSCAAFAGNLLPYSLEGQTAADKRLAYSSLQKFVCSHCLIETESPSAMEGHLNYHKDEGKHEFVCIQCKYKTYEECYLNHIAFACLHIDRDQNFGCNQCHFKANSRKKLILHLHTNTVKQLYCDLCSYTVHSTSTLQKHLEHENYETKPDHRADRERLLFKITYATGS